MVRYLYRLLILTRRLGLLACLINGAILPPALADSEHPLEGKIRDVQAQQFIDQADLLKQLSDVEYLLLGERHDNPVHHQHQRWFIQQLHRQERDASVAFEMIDQQQGERLGQQALTSPDQLIELLKPGDPGWEYETRYKDLFAATLEADYPVHAANLPRKQLIRFVMQNEVPMPDIYRDRLDDVPLNSQQTSNLRNEIKNAHCNMLAEENIPMMARAQRLRDAVMAESLRRSDKPLKVLIAGNGHVRNDRGVPIYLDQNATILTVGFIEVDSEHKTVSDYQAQWDNEQFPFDLIWFTPRQQRPEPCEQFRQQHQQGSVTAER